MILKVRGWEHGRSGHPIGSDRRRQNGDIEGFDGTLATPSLELCMTWARDRREDGPIANDDRSSHALFEANARHPIDDTRHPIEDT
jgi:hypothetical protein